MRAGIAEVLPSLIDREPEKTASTLATPETLSVLAKEFPMTCGNVAIARWRRSKRGRALEDQLVELRVALESTLIANDTRSDSDLRFRVATNGAWLLGKTFQDRKANFDSLSNAYRLASGVLHGRRLKSKDRDRDAATIAKSQELCRRAILAMIWHESVPDWEEFALNRGCERAEGSNSVADAINRPLPPPRIRSRTMAAFKIFYAWQSDRPAELCRSLVRKALDDVAEQLRDDLAIEDAPDIAIGQDTQGKAGSPPVADTILQKIRESDAFVADLTFTGCREGKSGSLVPNPNVLIEYGYALHAFGGNRVLAVFNEEFGDCKDLPFDISHRRRPSTYRTSGDRSDEQSQAARRTERKKLSGKLAQAIKTIVQEDGKRAEDSGAAVASIKR